MAVRSLASKVTRLEGTAAGSETLIGKVIAHPGPGKLTVEPSGGGRAVTARVAKAYSEAELRDAAAEGLDAVVIFGRGRHSQAVVIALLSPDDAAPLPPPSGARAAKMPPLEAVVDGQRVSIVGHDEITLKCGRASITLRRNGRVVVRGTHVETDSEGVNRIKGGTVKIN